MVFSVFYCIDLMRFFQLVGSAAREDEACGSEPPMAPFAYFLAAYVEVIAMNFSLLEELFAATTRRLS